MQPEPQCWHKRITDAGTCLDCGERAAIKLDHVPAIERICDDIAVRMQEMDRKLVAQEKIIADLKKENECLKASKS